MTAIRKEVHTRTNFANQIGLYYWDKINKSKVSDSGNIFTCNSMIKFQQARRIYIHYTNEYQRNQNLELSK